MLSRTTRSTVRSIAQPRLGIREQCTRLCSCAMVRTLARRRSKEQFRQDVKVTRLVHLSKLHLTTRGLSGRAKIQSESWCSEVIRLESIVGQRYYGPSSEAFGAAYRTVRGKSAVPQSSYSTDRSPVPFPQPFGLFLKPPLVTIELLKRSPCSQVQLAYLHKTSWKQLERRLPRPFIRAAKRARCWSIQ